MPELVITPAITEFVNQVRLFCQFVEQAHTYTLGERLVEGRCRLLELYRAGLSLPQVEPPDDIEGEWKLEQPKTWPGFGGFECYWEVFDPYDEEPPVGGSLSDDVLDVYRDVHRGLNLWEQNVPKTAATWEWRFHRDIHWGDHAADALRALHRACNRAGQSFVDFVEEAIFRWKNDPSARTARHRVFAWFYSMIDPPFLTKVTEEITESLRPVADEARAFLAEAADLGTLLVLAYVHWSTPWAFGPSDEEHARSRAFLLRAADVANDEELRAAIIERQNDGGAGLGEHSPGVARQVRLLFAGTSPYDEYFLHVLGGGTHQP